MAQVLHSIEKDPDHTVEIVVHITETPGRATERGFSCRAGR